MFVAHWVNTLLQAVLGFDSKCFFSCLIFIRSRSFLYHCLSPQNWCSCGTPPPEAVVHLGPHCSSTLPYHALLRGTFFGKKCPENGILIKCFLFRGTFCPFREKPRGTFWPKSAPKMKKPQNKCPGVRVLNSTTKNNGRLKRFFGALFGQKVPKSAPKN